MSLAKYSSNFSCLFIFFLSLLFTVTWKASFLAKMAFRHRLAWDSTMVEEGDAGLHILCKIT